MHRYKNFAQKFGINFCIIANIGEKKSVLVCLRIKNINFKIVNVEVMLNYKIQFIILLVELKNTIFNFKQLLDAKLHGTCIFKYPLPADNIQGLF